MTYVKVNGISLYYEFVNIHLLNDNSPLLIFLHEGLGCSEQWRDFPEAISTKTGLPAIYYDRLGYGKSQGFEGVRASNFLWDEAEQTLPQLLKELGFDNRKLILFGHSDGGTIALMFASLLPDRVLCAITEAAHVFTEPVTLNGLRQTVDIYSKTDLKEKLSRYHGDKTESMFRSWTQVWLSTDMEHWSMEDSLKSIRCPILAIQGSNDNYGSNAQLESIHGNVPTGVNVLIIPDCGHIPHHQARDVVENSAVQFILSVKNKCP
jgi:pimeloyl-ACP methyl ester carboxylesterase